MLASLNISSYFTPLFVVVFLPATIVLYALVPKRVRPYVLLVSSYLFAFSLSGLLVGYLVATTIATYLAGLGMRRIIAKRDAAIAEDPSTKRAAKKICKKRMRLLLAAGIIIGFGILIALKYLGFFGNAASSLLHLFGFDVSFSAPKIGVPIGISFYTLMAASYLVDVYRETVGADANFGRLALFLSFFPQIMEGPICRYDQTSAALWDGRAITFDNLYRGMLRITIGFAKKFIIANRLNLFVKPVFDNYASYDGGIIALAAILYTIQLYCDFSGCMDVAIGTANIFGVNPPENFRQPFFSKTASEFWQRWHITLGAWFKDYVYYPISLSAPVRKLTTKARKRFGSRYGPMITGSIALFCVWFGNGLWHGAGSQYLFFGMYYFVLIVCGGLIEPTAQALASKLGIDRDAAAYKAFRIGRTLVVIFVGELFFRANGLIAGFEMFSQIITNFSLDAFFDGRIFAVGMGAADFGVAAVFTALVVAADVARERKLDLVGIVTAKSVPARWAVWIAVFLLVVVFGAYGFGYVPLDPMYAQF